MMMDNWSLIHLPSCLAQTRNAKNKRSASLLLFTWFQTTGSLRQLAENFSCGCRIVKPSLTFAAIFGCARGLNLEPLRQILVEAGFQEISSEVKTSPSPIADQMP